ncbi:MAG: 30S ribosomal protein S27ae [archaeon]
MAEAKEVKRHVTSQVWKNYDGAKPKNRNCPKCGPGVFLAKHKNRSSCGKCGYTEFAKKE